MKDPQWVVVENIAWAAFSASCLFFLEGGWKFAFIVPLLFVNIPKSGK